MEDHDANLGPEKAEELELGLELWYVDFDDIHDSSGRPESPEILQQILQRMTANMEKRPWLATLPFCIIGEEDKIELIVGRLLLDVRKEVIQERDVQGLRPCVLIDVSTLPESETVAKAHAVYEALSDEQRAILSDMLEGHDSQPYGERVDNAVQLRAQEMRERAQELRELGEIEGRMAGEEELFGQLVFVDRIGGVVEVIKSWFGSFTHLFKRKRPIDATAYMDYLAKGLAVLESWSANLAEISEPEDLVKHLAKLARKVRPLLTDGKDMQPPRPLRTVHQRLLRTFYAMEKLDAAEQRYVGAVEKLGRGAPGHLAIVAMVKSWADEASHALDKKMAALERALYAAIRSGKLNDRRIVRAANRLFAWG